MMKVKNESFNSLVFNSLGGMAPECKAFIKNDGCRSQKIDVLLTYDSLVVSRESSWIKAKLSFALLCSAIFCIRGTRNPYYKNVVADTTDIDLQVHLTKIDDDWIFLKLSINHLRQSIGNVFSQWNSLEFRLDVDFKDSQAWLQIIKSNHRWFRVYT